jgi:hypothetical protein
MDNQDSLIFRDDWKPVYNPVIVDDETFSESEENNTVEKTEKKKKSSGKPLLPIIQIILCVTAIISLYALKNFGFSWFNDFYSWYDKNINNEIIISETFESFNLDSLLNEIKNK